MCHGAARLRRGCSLGNRPLSTVIRWRDGEASHTLWATRSMPTEQSVTIRFYNNHTCYVPNSTVRCGLKNHTHGGDPLRKRQPITSPARHPWRSSRIHTIPIPLRFCLPSVSTVLPSYASPAILCTGIGRRTVTISKCRKAGTRWS